MHYLNVYGINNGKYEWMEAIHIPSLKDYQGFIDHAKEYHHKRGRIVFIEKEIAEQDNKPKLD